MESNVKYSELEVTPRGLRNLCSRDTSVNLKVHLVSLPSYLLYLCLQFHLGIDEPGYSDEDCKAAANVMVDNDRDRPNKKTGIDRAAIERIFGETLDEVRRGADGQNSLTLSKFFQGQFPQIVAKLRTESSNVKYGYKLLAQRSNSDKSDFVF